MNNNNASLLLPAAVSILFAADYASRAPCNKRAPGFSILHPPCLWPRKVFRRILCRPHAQMAPQATTTYTPSSSSLPKPENHQFPSWAIVVIAVIGLLVACLVFYLFTRRHHHPQRKPARAIAKGSRAPSSAMRVGQRIG